VTCCAAISSASASTSRSCPGGQTTSFAPHTSGRKISLTEMSKPIGALNSAASPGPNPSSSRCHSRRFAMARCRIIAPFGVPVEPEVNIT
jgi:hypothetical protein